MTKTRAAALAAAIACGLASCSPPNSEAPRTAGAGGPSLAERGYAAPPTITGARRLTAGRLALAGSAAPAAKVRLASPTGEAMFATSDSAGDWRFVLPAAKGVRLFGLSAQIQGRPVQAEGYVAVTPSGEAAQLRAGSGAVPIEARISGPRILAADFDRKGGAVISGQGPAAGQLTMQVDSAAPAAVRADADGRFMVALNEPLATGSHVLAVTGAGKRSETAMTVSPAEPPNPGPFRATPIPGGWRIDWRTPGGGVQSTVLFEGGASGS